MLLVIFPTHFSPFLASSRFADMSLAEWQKDILTLAIDKGVLFPKLTIRTKLNLNAC